MAKTLVVYYSRDGTTKRVAGEIAKHLKADIEEIIDTKNRKGIFGYVFAGRDAMRKRLAEIKPVKKDPAKYDVVAIGTPIWGWSMTPAIRTYISLNIHKFKRVAFFCTMGGSGGMKTFAEMENILKKPIAVLELKADEVKGGTHLKKVKEFCRKVK